MKVGRSLAIDTGFNMTAVANTVGRSKELIRRHVYEYIKSYYPEYMQIEQRSRAKSLRIQNTKDRNYRERVLHGDIPKAFGTEQPDNKSNNKVALEKLDAYIKDNSEKLESGLKKALKGAKKPPKPRKMPVHKNGRPKYGQIDYVPSSEEEKISIMNVIKYFGKNNIKISQSGEIHVKVSTQSGLQDSVLHSQNASTPYIMYRGRPHEIGVTLSGNRKIVVIKNTLEI
jgi:hypothetical protein